MSEDKFNGFLDGELEEEALDEVTKSDLRLYSEALRVFRMRYDYRPSAKLEEKIMHKFTKPRRILWEVAMGIAVVAAAFYITFNLVPRRNVEPVMQESEVVSEVFDYLSLVKLVGDGF
ncbi:MAG: Uncharacterized protein XD58_0951 [Thermotoga sp. 50_1627]|uniref:hypothetical protein n=1 Tax=Pseudothermotoga sp. TaxID=2033661 RepID=UPI00076CFAF6|nr:MAG: Uncharacterized protein XD45_0986 [Thermotoga sp. 50_64]KUK25023.1 MAG: Uncharacterized protein XD58_0951 [Thermotoga sp. 50_1627]MBC7116371.1 hypothetical protein [Pseudothermotoga sp.]MDK2924066.1 hypothetical protein [Pseudothermotoga sp.]HBT39842.1 hypothetical protein [Pseudothermotoga sp.]